MAVLSEQVAAMMKKRAQEVKDRQASGQFTKNWSLTGKNSIVDAGAEVVVRFGPRWDIVVEKDGKLAKNPAYKSGEEPIFAAAWEHWWDAADGKIGHAWCPKTIADDAECPICIAAQYLMKSSVEDDRKEGKRIAAKEVFIFNAVVGNPRKLAEGKVDFRIMSVGGTVFTQLCDIMTGGAEASFARGNIGDVEGGYDLKLTRPRAGGNDRWKVDCAPQPSHLVPQAQAAAFANWPGLLTNIDEMLRKETKTALELFKAYYGRDPEGDELSVEARTGAEAQAETVAPVTEEPVETNAGPDLADEFMPGPSSTPAAPRAAAPQPPKAAPGVRPRTGGRR